MTEQTPINENAAEQRLIEELTGSPQAPRPREEREEHEPRQPGDPGTPTDERSTGEA